MLIQKFQSGGLSPFIQKVKAYQKNIVDKAKQNNNLTSEKQNTANNNYVSPLDSYRKTAAVNFLTQAATGNFKPNNGQVLNIYKDKEGNTRTEYNKEAFANEIKKGAETLVKKLIDSGDAARILSKKYNSPENSSSLKELTETALKSDPNFLNKIASHKYQEFLENDQKMYKAAPLWAKGTSFLTALAHDPVAVSAKILQGQRPAFAQVHRLDDPNVRAFGGLDSKMNVAVNIFNPFNSAVEASLALKNKDYEKAAINTLGAYLGVEGLGYVGRSGKILNGTAGNLNRLMYTIDKADNLIPALKLNKANVVLGNKIMPLASKVDNALGVPKISFGETNYSKIFKNVNPNSWLYSNKSRKLFNTGNAAVKMSSNADNIYNDADILETDWLKSLPKLEQIPLDFNIEDVLKNISSAERKNREIIKKR